MLQICYYSGHWTQDQENRGKGPVRWRKLEILLAQRTLPRSLPCSDKNTVNDDHTMNTTSIGHYIA